MTTLRHVTFDNLAEAVGCAITLTRNYEVTFDGDFGQVLSTDVGFGNADYAILIETDGTITLTLDGDIYGGVII